MRRFTSGIAALARLADKLAWLAVVGMMGLVVVHCISRRFGHPVYGAFDYVGFLMILVIAPALANCAVQKGHIYLSMLTDRLSKNTQLLIGAVVSTLNFLLMAVMTWLLFVRATRMVESGLTGMTSPIPVYPFIYIEAVAILLLCLVYLGDTFQSVNELMRKR